MAHPYRPIRSELGEIRLVHILPAVDFNAPLECRLEYTDIEKAKPYNALSYAWGKPKFTQKILLDDQPFPVTRNLESALRYIRQNTSRKLWIDAICIDQKNKNEKSEQIPLIRDIYRNCESDLLWLGDRDDIVIQVMKKLNAHLTLSIPRLLLRRRPNRHHPTVCWMPQNEAATVPRSQAGKDIFAQLPIVL
jgi:hypothetical protein